MDCRVSGLATKDYVPFQRINEVDAGTLQFSEEIISGQSTRYPLPRSYTARTPILEVFKRFSINHDPAVNSVTFNKCAVYESPRNLAILTKRGNLVDGVTVSMDKRCGLTEAQRKIIMPRIHNLKGHTLMLSTAMSRRCYYHWMMECLPRFRSLEIRGQSLSDFDHILIANDDLPFQRQTLEHFKVPIDKVVQCSERPAIYLCDEVTTTTHPVFHLPSKWAVRFIRNHFSPAETVSRPFRKLFISRQGFQRCLANEKELAQVLVNRGFKMVHLENL